MNAQGALGRLTTILLDEAHLLGRLRGDVEFIKDEMECMNALLLHLTDAQHRDRLIRAWMKQVVGLTRDCEGNVELYVRSVTDAGHHATGLLGYLRRMLRFVRTVPLRHQIATLIPWATGGSGTASPCRRLLIQVSDGSQGGEDFRRRTLLDIDVLEDEEAYINKGIHEMIELLSSEEFETPNGEPQPRVFSIMVWGGKWFGGYVADRIAQGVYERKMSSFGSTALVDIFTNDIVELLRRIVEQVAAVLPAQEQDAFRTKPEQTTETSRGDDDEEDEKQELIKTLGGYLKGKRFLIILQYVPSTEKWDRIRSLLLRAAVGCSPRSAIVITTQNEDVAESTYKIFRPQSLFSVFSNKAKELIGESDYHTSEGVREILYFIYPDVFAIKMLLHLLYVNPRRGRTQLDNFEEILKGCGPTKAWQSKC